MELLFWWGILGPRGLPDAVTARLEDALTQVLATPDMLRFLAYEGATPARLVHAAFQRLLVEETARWAEVARDAGIRIG